MHKSKKHFFLLGLLYWLSGCQTNPYVIRESLLSAKEHRRVFVAVIGDARMVSQNGREVYSHFHDRKFKFIDEPATSKVRYYTKATILGARRPYELSIEVREERKDPDSKLFLDQGPDDSLSQKRLDEVRLMLNQSRESSQEFDVENPF